MVFYKSCSGGNDFILLDQAELKAPPGPEQVVRWCHRHHGAGADGLLVYDTRSRPVSFRIYNRDGLEAELSGNGMAGLTALLVYLGHDGKEVILRSQTGEYRHQVLERTVNRMVVRIDLGLPDFHNTRFFPFLTEKRDRSIVEGIAYGNHRFHPVAVGNPQIVLFRQPGQSEEEALALAEALHQQTMFPQRTNVSIVALEGAGRGRIFFYERGVGPTQSSSTGAAGAYAVIRALNPGLSSFVFSTPGGSEVRVSGQEGIAIENVTRIVYKGEYLESADE